MLYSSAMLKIKYGRASFSLDHPSELTKQKAETKVWGVYELVLLHNKPPQNIVD